MEIAYSLFKFFALFFWHVRARRNQIFSSSCKEYEHLSSFDNGVVNSIHGSASGESY